MEQDWPLEAWGPGGRWRHGQGVPRGFRSQQQGLRALMTHTIPDNGRLRLSGLGADCSAHPVSQEGLQGASVEGWSAGAEDHTDPGFCWAGPWAPRT